MLEKALLFGQFVLGSLSEAVQFGWINCEQQSAFCAAMGAPGAATTTAGDGGTARGIQLVAVKAFHDHFQLFNEGQAVSVREDMVREVVRWITVLEREEAVFGAPACSDDNGTGKCDDSPRGEGQWTEGVLFPIATPKLTDSWESVLGGLGTVMGFVGSGLSGTASTVSTIVSAVFQGFFVILLFVFLLPMLRMAR